MDDSATVVRRAYEAFANADRPTMEALVADDYRFWSPHDAGIDRATYFERCWPGSGRLGFALDRVITSGDEVVVTYTATREDGTRFRNTEVHTVRDGRMVRTEVYFGWDQ